MARSPKAIVDPTLLVWARESAGLTIEAVADRLKLKDPEDKLRAWEDPEDVESRPTVAQLRSLARIYKRPLAVFYLDEPPTDFQPVRDFRRMADHSHADDVSIELRSELARVVELQEAASTLIADDAESEAVRFRVTADLRSNPNDVATTIRRSLGVDLSTQVSWPDPYTALREWRGTVEDLGVLVCQVSGIALSEMRGFSIHHERAPLVCLNGADHVHGRIFTLFHELAHLTLRQAGLCEWHAGRQSAANERIETWCNAVAGAVLVPGDALLALPALREVSGPKSWPDEEIQGLARHFSVSRHVILRRLLTLERATRSFYRTRESQLLAEYRRRAETESGPFPVAYERRVTNKLGRSFIGLVLTSYYENRLTLSDASSLIGVRVKHLPAVEQEVMGWSHIQTAGA